MTCTPKHANIKFSVEFGENNTTSVLDVQSRDISIRHSQKRCAKFLPPLCTLSTGKLDAGRAFGQ